MELFALLILLAASAGGSYRILHQKRELTRTSNSLFVLGLGYLSIALATLGQLILDPLDQNASTLLRILVNLAFYAALPMMVTALISLKLSKEINRAGWGRWLLALIALFELLRRMEQGSNYTQALIIALLAGLAAWIVVTEEWKSRLAQLPTLLAALGSGWCYQQNYVEILPMPAALTLILLSYTSLLPNRPAAQ